MHASRTRTRPRANMETMGAARLVKEALASLVSLAAVAFAPQLAQAAVCGDLNDSGGPQPRTVADAVLLLEAVVGADPGALCGGAGVLDCGNVVRNPADGAAQIRINDVVALLNDILGNETLFEPCDG